MNIIDITDRKFLCQPRNGSTFATNPTTDYTTYWQANAIGKYKLVTTVEVSTITEASIGAEILATVSGSTVIMVHPINNWQTEGFVVGNTIIVEANGNSTTGTITQVAGQAMTFTDASFVANLGVVSGDSRADYVIKSTTVPTSLIFKYGVIPNSQTTPTFVSPLTGEPQVYSGGGITSSLTDLNWAGTNIAKLGTVQAKYVSTTSSYIFEFIVEHVFQSPYLIPSWISNYINETIPIEFQGTNSFKYVCEFNFGTNINNTNDLKTFVDDLQNGSVGFYNQNFNSGLTNYTLSSFTYPNGEGTIDADNGTDIEIVIKKNDGNWTAGERAYIYHTKLPNNSEINAGLTDTFEEIFLFSSGTNVDGAVATTTGVFTDLFVEIDSGDATLLNITATINYTAEQLAFIDDGDQFFIGVEVEDGALSATLSDRTVVYCEQNTWDKSADFTGLITNNQINFFKPGQNTGTATPETGFYTWNNRIIWMVGEFRLTKTQFIPFSRDNYVTILRSFKVQIVAMDNTTNEFFPLDEYVFPFGASINQTVDDTLYQVFNILETNTVGVPSSSSLNYAILSSTVPGSFQNYQQFDWQLALEIPWRQWIQNLDAQTTAPIFYSNTPTEFNNFNERTSNYSELNNYSIYTFATAVVAQNGINTEYHMRSDKCKVADFDVDALGTGWSGDTVYYDEAGDEVDVFPIGQDIHVEITIQNPGAALTGADILAEIVIEVNGSNGRDYRLHNTLDWSEPANYLKPLAGETYVKVTQGTGPNTVILECLIKKEKIQQGDSGQTFNTYGHLYLGK